MLNKISAVLLCFGLIGVATALIRQRPVIGGFSPIEDLNSVVVREAANNAIKAWNEKSILNHRYVVLG